MCDSPVNKEKIHKLLTDVAADISHNIYLIILHSLATTIYPTIHRGYHTSDFHPKSDGFATTAVASDKMLITN
eukprot:scaffold114797_cov51-Attheya_sp.AAC.7